MKKILLVLLALLLATKSAFAGTCEERIGLAFTAEQRKTLCRSFGSAINNSLIPSADNTYDLGSAAKSWKDLFVDGNALVGGTLGVTGISTLVGNVKIGSNATPSSLQGSTDGRLTLGGAALSTGNITVEINHASAAFRVNNSSGSSMWTFADTGTISGNSASSGNIILAKSGTTVALDSGTAASTCSGTLTANGATPVVTSTTCALTASRIFLSKQSASTAVNGSCTVTAISNGVSFTVACLATDTGTYNFWITQEG